LVAARDGSIVGLDTQLPNKIVGRALELRTLEEFSEYELDRTEYSHGDSRFDFLLRGNDGQPCILEVKSVTLAVDGVGRFPDAVTTRGRRHVSGLTTWAAGGHDAAILFVVQRSDVRRVEAAAEIDPEFATALAAASKAGVRLLARSCALSPQGVRWGARLSLTGC